MYASTRGSRFAVAERAIAPLSVRGGQIHNAGIAEIAEKNNFARSNRDTEIRRRDQSRTYRSEWGARVARDGPRGAHENKHQVIEGCFSVPPCEGTLRDPCDPRV